MNKNLNLSRGIALQSPNLTDNRRALQGLKDRQLTMAIDFRTSTENRKDCGENDLFDKG